MFLTCEAVPEGSCRPFASRHERAIFGRWQQLVAQHQAAGKTGHKCAAGVRHGIKHLVSFNDQHFHQFPNITVIHPDGIDSLQTARHTSSGAIDDDDVRPCVTQDDSSSSREERIMFGRLERASESS